MNGLQDAGIGMVVGVVAVGVIGILLLVRAMRPRPGADVVSSPPAEAPVPPAMAQEPDDGHRRVLVLLTSDGIDERVCREVLNRNEPVDVRVVAPIPAGHVARWLTGDDRASGSLAQARLDQAVAAFGDCDVPVSGVLGDLSVAPEQLIQDQLAVFRPHEVMLVMHPDSDQQWIERDLVAHAVAQLDLPMAVIHSSVSAVDRAA